MSLNCLTINENYSILVASVEAYFEFANIKAQNLQTHILESLAITGVL